MRDLIKDRNFKKALELVDFSNFEEIYNQLYKFAYEDEDIVYYDFINYIIENIEDGAEMNYFASELMSNALNILPDAYNIALKHAQRALVLNPRSIKLKEYMLLFYEIPEKLIDQEYAFSLAKEILDVDDKNPAAKRVLLDRSSLHS